MRDKQELTEYTYVCTATLKMVSNYDNNHCFHQTKTMVIESYIAVYVTTCITECMLL